MAIIHFLAIIGLYEVVTMLRNSTKETKQTIGLIAIVITAIAAIFQLSR